MDHPCLVLCLRPVGVSVCNSMKLIRMSREITLHRIWALSLSLRETLVYCREKAVEIFDILRLSPFTSDPVVTMSTLETLQTKLNCNFETKHKTENLSEILKLLKKLFSTSVLSIQPVSYFKSTLEWSHSDCITLVFTGDENTVDVGTDDNLLLAYHFHIPEGLCGEF